MKVLIVAIALVGLGASYAAAGSYAGTCTTEPLEKWQPVAAIEAEASSIGFSVSKSKIAGSCYEVHATRDGKRFELYFDPVSALLVRSVTK